MNKFLKHLEKNTKHIRLSDAEKSVMRARLHEAMGISLQPRVAKSPYCQWFLMPRIIASSFLALVVLVGTGTAYAAEGSLPGDLLYPLKINITERAEIALALSPKAKVAVNTKLAQRRIAEVEVLAVRGVLDAATTAQAEVNFDYHTARVVALTHQKNNKAHNEDRAVFSAKVSASLGDEGDVGTSTMSAAAPEREEKEQLTEESKKRSAKENSYNFKKHVRASVQTILDLEVDSDTEVSSTKLEDRTPHQQDNFSGGGEESD